MAKIKLRIPLEQFQFIEVELEDTSPERTAEIYREYADAFKAKPGLPNKDWIKAVDEYCNTGTLIGGTELYAQMNEKQQFFFQTLKLSNKRREAKNK